jgi:hypothetical protein
MELSRNEQLVIDVLLDNPSISNRELANRTYIAQADRDWETLNV